jgi:hypothetical protein
MNNELNLYHKILFLELRPWTNREVAETKYKELMQGISKEHFSFQPLYEVDFPKPLTAKRKYYFSIIENEATNYLNNFQQIIAGALNEKEKQYWVHTTLTKVLSQKLREVSKVIDDSQYFFQQLSAASKASTPESKIQDEAYILQYLKYQLIRIYLEIQETFRRRIASAIFFGASSFKIFHYRSSKTQLAFTCFAGYGKASNGAVYSKSI